MNLWRPDGKPSHVLEFQLDEHSNTPTAVNVSCTAEEPLDNWALSLVILR